MHGAAAAALFMQLHLTSRLQVAMPVTPARKRAVGTAIRHSQAICIPIAHLSKPLLFVLIQVADVICGYILIGECALHWLC